MKVLEKNKAVTIEYLCKKSIMDTCTKRLNSVAGFEFRTKI